MTLRERTIHAITLPQRIAAWLRGDDICRQCLAESTFDPDPHEHDRASDDGMPAPPEPHAD